MPIQRLACRAWLWTVRPVSTVPHSECGGRWIVYRIAGFRFARCGRCARFLGGDATLATVRTLGAAGYKAARLT